MNMRWLTSAPWRSLRWPAERAVARQQRALSSRPFTIEGALTELAPGEIPAVGVEASVTHTFTVDDTTRFAALNGDNNPIHTDAAFALREAGVSAPIVQGMLSASLFATIFGRTIPGCVYVSQELRFRAPLLVDEPVRARIKVINRRKRFVDCETICEKVSDSSVVVEGKAIVLFPASPSPSSSSSAA